MPPSYNEIVRSLPPPTRRQTALFATYVAEAHSWYKHLPVHTKVPFHFFLDPHVGMYVTRDARGRASLRSIEDTKDHIHYTAQKTVDYRRRFGFWNYDAQYGTSLVYRVGDHVADTRPLGPRIVNNEGDWISVSSKALELGRADVDAFVHPHPSLHNWESRLRGNPSQTEPATFSHVEECLKKRHASTSNIDLATIPSAIQALLDLRIDRQGYLGSLWNKDELYEELLDLVPGNAQTKDATFPALLEHLEFRRSRIELKWVAGFLGTISDSDSDSNSTSNDLQERFHTLLGAERLQQLRAINAALNRVVEFV